MREHPLAEIALPTGKASVQIVAGYLYQSCMFCCAKTAEINPHLKRAIRKIFFIMIKKN